MRCGIRSFACITVDRVCGVCELGAGGNRGAGASGGFSGTGNRGVGTSGGFSGDGNRGVGARGGFLGGGNRGGNLYGAISGDGNRGVGARGSISGAENRGGDLYGAISRSADGRGDGIFCFCFGRFPCPPCGGVEIARSFLWARDL